MARTVQGQSPVLGQISTSTGALRPGALPPLANLLAIYEPDPHARGDLQRHLKASGEFEQVSEPVSGWTLGVSPLPGSAADPSEIRHAGLVFAEGRDEVDLRDPRRIDDFIRIAATTPEQLDRFPGDASFVHLAPQGRATVVRSPGGLVPLYVTRRADRVAITTRISYLSRFLPDPPHADPLVHAAWTSGFGPFPDNRSFLAGVLVTPRGHAAQLAPGQTVRFIEFWNPWPKRVRQPTENIRREHVMQLRTQLLEVLGRDLSPSGGNLLSLSGGVDSSAIAAIAAGHLGFSLMTVSFLPPDPDDAASASSYIVPLREAFDLRPYWSFPLDWETRRRLLEESPRIGVPIIHPVLGALRGLKEQAPIRVLVGGEFADEVCGTLAAFPDWAAQTGPLALLRSGRSLPSGSRDILRWVKWRSRIALRRPLERWPADLPSFVRKELREQYREWRYREHRAAGRAAVAHRALRLRSRHDGWIAMNWEATSALGVRRSIPFHTRGMLELMASCHMSELIGPGDKRLLRTAVSDLVPPRNIQRTHPGTYGGGTGDEPSDHVDAWPESLSNIVCPDWLNQAMIHGATKRETFSLSRLRIAIEENEGAWPSRS